MLSDPLTISSGTRQGYPMSHLIFAFVIESLAESIRSCNDIKGLTIGQEEHIIGLYADDILLALTDPPLLFTGATNYFKGVCFNIPI